MVARRDVVKFGGAFALLGATKFANSQTVDLTRRGAVVIGVSEISGMPKLSASSDADRVAKWLHDEGFDVEKFTDTNGAVEAAKVREAIENKFIGSAPYDLLVIYFAGHGLMTKDTDWWLLSGAPKKGNEAISFSECVNFGRNCGVSNVVIISDACRTLPMTPQAMRIGGSQIFPNEILQNGNVDELKAASLGAPAYEQDLIDAIATKGGIFTDVLLEAFKNPWNNMTETLPSGEVVILNSKLKEYLIAGVDGRAQSLSVTHRQVPDINVVSEVYLAQVRSQGGTPQKSGALQPASKTEIVDRGFQKLGLGFSNGTYKIDFDLRKLDLNPIFETFANASAQVDQYTYAKSFESQSGISVVATNVVDIIASPNVGAVRVSDNNIGVTHPAGASVVEVLLEFPDRAFAVLPVIKGFITNVAWSALGIGDVSFVPSANAEFYGQYDLQRQQVRSLQTVFAGASSIGGFRIEGDTITRQDRAGALYKDIGSLTTVSPDLAVQAAYVFDKAGLLSFSKELPISSLPSRGSELFDIAMLYRFLNSDQPDGFSDKIFPAWPMMAQGWDYLRPLNVRTTLDLLELRPYLLPSTWTTMDIEAKPRVTEFVLNRKY